jgi:tetratricopeptide (TPR) repeat protein
LEQGKASQALAYLDKALEFDPEHEQALLNSAILLQELGRAELRKVARERLLKLLRKVSDANKMRFDGYGVHIVGTVTHWSQFVWLHSGGLRKV